MTPDSKHQLKQLQNQFRARADKEKAQQQQRFFKTGPGEYAEGDVFLGIVVPETRKFAKQHQHLSFNGLKILIRSQYHEERFLALIILILQYEKSDTVKQQQIVDFYLKHRRHINNWDLVDVSAYKIVGKHLLHSKERGILYDLAASPSLWDRRIAVLSTYAFIKDGQFDDILRLAQQLLEDPEDLMHKAIGWMLREMGKLYPQGLEDFLHAHLHSMPRTMLRYAIEKLPQPQRRKYLSGKL